MTTSPKKESRNQEKPVSGLIQAGGLAIAPPNQLPDVAGELDVFLGAGFQVGVFEFVEVLGNFVAVATTGGDDGAEVVGFVAAALEHAFSLVDVACEDVGEGFVNRAAGSVGQGRCGLVVAADEHIDDAQVGLGLCGLRLGEAILGGF